MSRLEVLEKLVIPSMTPVEGKEYEGEVYLPEDPGLKAIIESNQRLKKDDRLVVSWKTEDATETVLDHKVTLIEEENSVQFFVGKNFIAPGVVTADYEVTRGDMIFRSKKLIIMVK
ncbi:hypothetical protein ACYZT2_08360 [Pseudomonas sp. MDT1-85]